MVLMPTNETGDLPTSWLTDIAKLIAAVSASHAASVPLPLTVPCPTKAVKSALPSQTAMP
jgi:hypothetical protein